MMGWCPGVRGRYRIPHRRGADARGVSTYDFAKFSKKLHENGKILGQRGDKCQGCPLGSTTGSGEVIGVRSGGLVGVRCGG